MKKSTYVDYNVLLACLSQKKTQDNQEVNRPYALVEALPDFTALFDKYYNHRHCIK